MGLVFGALHLEEPWVWRIVHWSRGALKPHELREEWTTLDVIELLDVLDAHQAVEQVVAAHQAKG